MPEPGYIDLIPKIAPLIWAIFAFGGSALAIWWTNKQGLAILERWADQNGYLIIHYEYRVYRRGPFFLRSSNSRPVYRIVVIDYSGKKHAGWFRCGSQWFSTKVIWDEPSVSDRTFWAA